ncbi:hypothetical protein T07_1921 [Trichinella nelsoni]|uniref:Uncharacterized protein n=1 Tax=Trichinella nelsoni TaxID=6336 RepID=A0A0V0SB87_9BILA|nr:hypothetical protein T07_1921 [Trichinella nelsoni]
MKNAFVIKQTGGSCRLVEALLMSGAVGPTSEVRKNHRCIILLIPLAICLLVMSCRAAWSISQ